MDYPWPENEVVETFDRETNLREVKLVYSTLVRVFYNQGKTKSKNPKVQLQKRHFNKIRKEKILTEGSELRDRFKVGTG